MSSEGDQLNFHMRLIDAVRRRRCLYDSKDANYRNSEHKAHVWNELVSVLDFQGEVRQLYNRWKQLRDKFGKERKKLLMSTGESNNDDDASGWRYYSALKFLEPHMGMHERAEHSHRIYDEDFTFKLIQEVRHQKCLYDITDKNYRNVEYRGQVWASIVDNLDFDGDAISLYKQWKRIRDRYVKEKKKSKMTSESGESDECTWEHFQHMTWIDHYLDMRSYGNKRKRPSNGDESALCDDDELAFDAAVLDDDDDDDEYLSPPPSQSHTYNHRVFGHEQSHVRHVTAAAYQHPHADILDGDRAFALSVASDIGRLSDEQRAVAKMRIQQVLTDARFINTTHSNFELKLSS